MKKFLALTMLLASSVMFVPSAEAKTNAATESTNAASELNAFTQRIWQGNRRVRIVNRTRIVRRGYRTYRETWQYRYFGNGRVTSRLVSRVRIR